MNFNHENIINTFDTQTERDINNFKEKLKCFNDEERRQIESALNLMIKLHINQKSRPDGKPYISHPLEVADDILVKYGVKDKDIIIAALLHDSVEDQSLALARKYIKSKALHSEPDLLDKEDIEKILDMKLEEIALTELKEMFGERVGNIIKNLSNPDFNKIIAELEKQGIKKTKFDLYKEHVAEAVKDPDTCVVKYADFARNALAIDNIDDEAKKEKLKKKYGPVIKEVFLKLFKNIGKGHPLYSKKDEIIHSLEDYYRKYY